MSDDTWPESGPGVRGGGAGSSRAPRPRRVTMYDRWLEVMEPVSFGRSIMIRVPRPQFFANLQVIRRQLDPEGRDTAATNERIRVGMERYARDIQSRKISMDGKPAWPIFMRMWVKYVPETTGPASDEDVASGHRPWYA